MNNSHVHLNWNQPYNYYSFNGFNLFPILHAYSQQIYCLIPVSKCYLNNNNHFNDKRSQGGL